MTGTINEVGTVWREPMVEQPRIAFDDEPGRDLSPEQASAALKYMYRHHPSQLADAILYANGFDKNANVKGRGERYKGRANG